MLSFAHPKWGVNPQKRGFNYPHSYRQPSDHQTQREVTGRNGTIMGGRCIPGYITKSI